MKPFFDDGQITLYCGRWQDVLPTLADKSVDLTLTDPPFNARVKYGAGVDDNRPWPDYCDDMEAFVDQAERVTRGMVLVFASVTGALHLIARRRPKWVAAWAKPPGTANGHQVGNSGFMGFWEPCLVYGQTWGEGGRVPPWSLPDVWPVSTAKPAGSGHPCPKPVELLRYILGRHPAETVLDPFAGRGTTLRAAKDLGKRAVGVEVNPDYCAAAVRLLSQQVLPLAG